MRKPQLLLLTLTWLAALSIRNSEVEASSKASLMGITKSFLSLNIPDWARIIFRAPDSGALGRTQAGSRRGPCNDSETTYLRTLVPLSRYQQDTSDNSRSTVLGVTSTAHPFFWFYVSSVPDDVSEIRFRLWDDNERTALSNEGEYVTIPVTGRSEIIGLQLTSTSLSPNSSYRWFVDLICDKDNPSRNPTAEGWIEYRQVEQNQASAIANSQDRIRSYADQGFWHEVLEELYILKEENPDSEWVNDQLAYLLQDYANVSEEAILAERDVRFIVIHQ